MANENTPENSQTEPEQKKEPDLATMVNAAVKSHISRQLKDLDLDSKFKSISDAIESMKKTSEPEPKKGKKDEDPEFVAMRQKLEEVSTNFTKAQQRAEEAERKRRDEQTRNDVRDHLQKTVRPEMIPFLTDYLLKASGKIEYDADGTPLFKHRMAPGAGMAEEDVLMPLSDGLDAYLRTNDAKPFLPAPASGAAPKTPAATRAQRASVSGPPKYDKPASTDEEKIRRAMEKEEYIRQMQSKT
jgi:hypothetical protein